MTQSSIHESSLLRILLFTVAAILLAVPSSFAAAPELYDNPYFQSPVSGEPDDLLMIAGFNIDPNAAVVYQMVTDTSNLPSPPNKAPRNNTESLGVVPVIAAGNGAITVHLPLAMAANKTYVLWVKNPRGGYGNPVLINDVRPLWITPAQLYEYGTPSILPRELKIVGRNMHPASGTAGTLVRLTGIQTYLLTAIDDGDEQTRVENYVARVALPDYLPAGSYQVEVSRDGANWVSVPDMQLQVSPLPSDPPDFPVSAYGCFSDDGLDDTPCIISAIEAASAAGGGDVIFTVGQWDLLNLPDTTITTMRHGIVVPQGVNIVGAGPQYTKILTSPSWTSTEILTAFTLQGNNVVTGIHFDDVPNHEIEWTNRFSLLQFGKFPPYLEPGDPTVIEDILIHDNYFTNSCRGVVMNYLPARRIQVLHNVFSAYEYSLFLHRRYGAYLEHTFSLEDSIVRHNTFYPGEYLNAPRAGTIGSALSGGERVDFSDNRAEGRWDFVPPAGFTQCTPGTVPEDIGCGWRAAFFWDMWDSEEMVLVHDNFGRCTGDKTGDGEFIAFDSAANKSAYVGMRSALKSSASSVTIEGPMIETIPGYYNNFWVQIVDGKGAGQTRPITSYQELKKGEFIFNISPGWDVVPDRTSAITVSKENWQVYILDNEVDIRGCEKDNWQSRSGIIILMGGADSAIAGNEQYESDGIRLSVSYNEDEGDYAPNQRFIRFTEVTGNRIYGEFDWDDIDGIGGGMVVDYGNSYEADIPPLGFGISISENYIEHADAHEFGAIALDLWWHPSLNDTLVNTMIFHNTISDVQRLDDDGVCLPPERVAWKDEFDGGVAVQIQNSSVNSTILYGNVLEDVCYELVDNGTSTLVCTYDEPTSTLDCE